MIARKVTVGKRPRSWLPLPFGPRLKKPTLPASAATTDEEPMCQPCDDQANAHDIGVVWHFCDQPGCAYKNKQKSHLQTHKAGRHDIGVVWHHCDQPGCEHKCKDNGKLKTHQANVHGIGVVWHHCDQPGCEHKCKDNGKLKRHQAHRHDIGVVWHYCDQPGCKYKAKQKRSVKQHKADAHDIGVVWHHCDQPECEYKCKQKCNLNIHKVYSHDIGVVWHHCDQPGCEFKCKQKGTVKQHKTDAHGIGVVCHHHCDQPGCKYKAKQNRSVKQHKADVHDIEVVWHVCDAASGECDFQAKQAGNLTSHIQSCHARVYAQRRKEQEERVRKALLDAGWEEHRLAEAMPPVRHFRREKRIDFSCAQIDATTKFARLDFVLGVPNGYVFLEVDEHQHQYGYDALISCDMRRMSHVMESLAVETGGDMPCLYWLRYNPHAWHVGGTTRKMPKAQREANLVAWLEQFECVAPLGIGYAFYDCEAKYEADTLAVLDNGDYHPHYAEVVENLGDLQLA